MKLAYGEFDNGPCSNFDFASSIMAQARFKQLIPSRRATLAILVLVFSSILAVIGIYWALLSFSRVPDTTHLFSNEQLQEYASHFAPPVKSQSPTGQLDHRRVVEQSFHLRQLVRALQLRRINKVKLRDLNSDERNALCAAWQSSQTIGEPLDVPLRVFDWPEDTTVRIEQSVYGSWTLSCDMPGNSWSSGGIYP